MNNLLKNITIAQNSARWKFSKSDFFRLWSPNRLRWQKSGRCLEVRSSTCLGCLCRGSDRRTWETTRLSKEPYRPRPGSFGLRADEGGWNNYMGTENFVPSRFGPKYYAEMSTAWHRQSQLLLRTPVCFTTKSLLFCRMMFSSISRVAKWSARGSSAWG